MESNARIALGHNIRRHRQHLDISQEMLAEQAGLHRTYIGGVERGERNISLDNIICVARALNLTPSELMQDII